MTLTYDLDVQSPARYGHDVYLHVQAKVQGQRSVGSEDIEWKQPVVQMGGCDCITSLANTVGNKRSNAGCEHSPPVDSL